VVQPDLVRDGRLIVIMPEWHFRIFDLWMVHPSNRHISRPVRPFKEFAVPMARALFPSLPATSLKANDALSPWGQDLGETVDKRRCVDGVTAMKRAEVARYWEANAETWSGTSVLVTTSIAMG
jgi:hypothetical protein